MKCNICENQTFGAGPGGRMSIDGVPPRCEKCQSLERHRIYRKVFKTIVSDKFSQQSFLQFSNDRTVDPEWFKSHEVSVYGGENSLDIQKIERETNHYDIVMCNHVLEHVPYDNAALNELLRITKDNGFVFLTIPSPYSQDRTIDWGYPKEEQHGHYRIYGNDFTGMLKRYVPNAWVLTTTENDDVTNTKDIVFFISKTKNGLNPIFASFTNLVSVQEGINDNQY